MPKSTNLLLPDDCELFLYTPEGEGIETHWYYAPATEEDE
jgi:hypothetical protein